MPKTHKNILIYTSLDKNKNNEIENILKKVGFYQDGFTWIYNLKDTPPDIGPGFENTLNKQKIDIENTLFKELKDLKVVFYLNRGVSSGKPSKKMYGNILFNYLDPDIRKEYIEEFDEIYKEMLELNPERNNSLNREEDWIEFLCTRKEEMLDLLF